MPMRNCAAPLIVAFSCLISSTTLAETSTKFPRPIGAGSFPVTFTCASVWFAHRADESQKQITLMVYMDGTAGWDRQQTDFKWEVNGDPATIEMAVGTTHIGVKYSASTGSVEIQGSKYDLVSSNVFMVEGIDGAQPQITPLGIHDLSFAPDDVPALALLRRDADVWAAESGRSHEDYSKHRNASAPERLVAWDTEGLRLLLTEKPDAEKEGCELFRRAAVEGYAPSQYRLGYCYESGRGEDQNFATANSWYEKAAVQGHVDAQYKLGHSYRVGRGVSIDLPLALQWYKKAAQNGDGDALNNIGWMYDTGQGVAADHREAFRWLVEAAKHGETGSQFEVARRLRDGNGTERDLVGSYAWFLVLQAQKSDFSDSDWKQIKAVMETFKGQLDKASLALAFVQTQDDLAIISRNQMESFARQQ
jgi:TPR repeat protein